MKIGRRNQENKTEDLMDDNNLDYGDPLPNPAVIKSSLKFLKMRLN